MGKSFSRTVLEEKTSKELKRMCVDELGIVGVTKKPKEDVINAIMAQYGKSGAGATVSKAPAVSKKVTAISFSGQSTLTKPNSPFWKIKV